MPQKPTGTWEFGRAVLLRAWTYYVYGGCAGVLFVWEATVGQVPRWLYLALIPIAVLVGSFLTWREERVDRNKVAAEVAGLNGELTRLNGEIDRLSRPRFLAEVRDPIIRSEHQQPNRMKLYVQLLVRNQGADSAIDRWVVVVLPPQPATPFIRTETGLSESQQGPGDNFGGNLLHDHEIIRRGGTKEGWLLCEGERMGLTETQTAVVEVSFRDVHNNEYHFVSRPGFQEQMANIRMGRR